MMAKDQKNQFPAYALKSDNGENEEHWNQVKIFNGQTAIYKVTPFESRSRWNPEKPASAWLVKILDFRN